MKTLTSVLVHACLPVGAIDANFKLTHPDGGLKLDWNWKLKGSNTVYYYMRMFSRLEMGRVTSNRFLLSVLQNVQIKLN